MNNFEVNMLSTILDYNNYAFLRNSVRELLRDWIKSPASNLVMEKDFYGLEFARYIGYILPEVKDYNEETKIRGYLDAIAEESSYFKRLIEDVTSKTNYEIRWYLDDKYYGVRVSLGLLICDIVDKEKDDLHDLWVNWHILDKSLPIYSHSYTDYRSLNEQVIDAYLSSMPYVWAVNASLNLNIEHIAPFVHDPDLAEKVLRRMFMAASEKNPLARLFGRKDNNTVGANICDSLIETMDSQGIITLVNNTYKKIFTDIYNDNYKLFQDKGLFIKRRVVKV